LVSVRCIISEGSCAVQRGTGRIATAEGYSRGALRRGAARQEFGTKSKNSLTDIEEGYDKGAGTDLQRIPRVCAQLRRNRERVFHCEELLPFSGGEKKRDYKRKPSSKKHFRGCAENSCRPSVGEGERSFHRGAF